MISPIDRFRSRFLRKRHLILSDDRSQRWPTVSFLEHAFLSRNRSFFLAAFVKERAISSTDTTNDYRLLGFISIRQDKLNVSLRFCTALITKGVVFLSLSLALLLSFSRRSRTETSHEPIEEYRPASHVVGNVFLLRLRLT